MDPISTSNISMVPVEGLKLVRQDLAPRVCPKCGRRLTRSGKCLACKWTRRNSDLKEVNKMSDQYAIVKMTDLEEVDAGDSTRIVVKAGATVAVMDIGGVEDSQGVAQAFDKMADLVQETDLRKYDDSDPEVAEELVAKALEPFMTEFNKMSETVGKLANQPRQRPAPQLVESPMAKFETDNAEQDTHKDLYAAIVGKADATHQEATATVMSWVQNGELDKDLHKRALQQKLVDVNLMQKLPGGGGLAPVIQPAAPTS